MRSSRKRVSQYWKSWDHRALKSDYIQLDSKTDQLYLLKWLHCFSWKKRFAEKKKKGNFHRSKFCWTLKGRCIECNLLYSTFSRPDVINDFVLFDKSSELAAFGHKMNDGKLVWLEVAFSYSCQIIFSLMQNRLLKAKPYAYTHRTGFVVLWYAGSQIHSLSSILSFKYHLNLHYIYQVFFLLFFPLSFFFLSFFLSLKNTLNSSLFVCLFVC